jgi:hypothetical protein
VTTREVALRYYPRPWQRECHLRRKRFTVLALHRRAGKTHLAIAELVDHALRFPLEAGLFFYVAPFLKQAKAIAWSRLKLFVEPLRIVNAVEVSESELSVTFKHNGAAIRIYGADNPDAMRGVRLDGAVLDEVAQMKPEVWHDIIRPCLADRKGWALFIGTPKGVNMFSELYFKAEVTPDWFAARYTVYDTNTLDPAEVEAMRLEMPENTFAREFLCDFSAAGDNQLISLNDVIVASQRQYSITEYMYSPKILGVDPARFGDDRSVIFPRQGIVASPPLVFEKMDNMELASRVIQKKLEWGADAVFVDAGNGAGVIDRIRQLGHDCTEVWFGGTPLDPQYKDKRTEMWCLMAEDVTNSLALPDRMQLRHDLAGPTYGFDSRGRKMLESKDALKSRGLPSPDEGDALALTYAHPVAPKPRSALQAQLEGASQAQAKEYDPLA